MENELLRISKLVSNELHIKTKKWLDYFQKKKIPFPDCIAVIDSKELTLEWNRKTFTIYVDLSIKSTIVECCVHCVRCVRFEKNLHDEKIFKNEDISILYRKVGFWINTMFEKYK